MRAKQCLRVGVLNNFNHTDQEIAQVKKLEKKWNVFVNSNSKTPIKYGPCIVTVNPDLDKFVEPVGDITLIAAARIKVIAGAKLGPSAAMRDAYIWAQQNNVPVLLTAMRFPSLDMLNVYSDDPSLYEWKGGYYRLKDWGKIQSPPNSFYCDKEHKGCPSCKNCVILTFKDPNLEIYGMNLSSSGVCPFNCPGCFAKKCLRMTKTKTPLFDKAFRNKKQRGDI